MKFIDDFHEQRSSDLPQSLTSHYTSKYLEILSPPSAPPPKKNKKNARTKSYNLLFYEKFKIL